MIVLKNENKRIQNPWPENYKCTGQINQKSK